MWTLGAATGVAGGEEGEGENESQGGPEGGRLQGEDRAEGEGGAGTSAGSRKNSTRSLERGRTGRDKMRGNPKTRVWLLPLTNKPQGRLAGKETWRQCETARAMAWPTDSTTRSVMGQA